MRDTKNKRIGELAKSMKFNWIEAPMDYKRFDEGERNHKISNFTIPAMQALGLLLALAVVCGFVIGFDEIFRYWRVFFLNL